MTVAISRFIVSIFLISLLTSCTRPPQLVGIDNPQIPVASVATATKRKVFLMTTREASEVVGVFYSGDRAPELGLASVTVSIPPNHVAGEIERPKALPPDPATEFAIVEPTVFETDSAFISHLNRELAKLPAKDREILFFIHGYNNTVSDALLRISQFAEDTDFAGIPVLFSWASAAKPSRYVYDMNSALIARPRLLDAAAIISRTNTKGVNLFAHSMGAFLTVEALVQARLAGRRSHRLNNVMLAAPDIDMDLFKTQLAILPIDQKNIFVFVSHDDKALGFSRRISGGVERAGAADDAELTALGVTVIDLSKVEDSTSGTHSKFAGSPEVVQLIGRSLHKDNFNKPNHSPTLVEILDGVPVLRVITP